MRELLEILGRIVKLAKAGHPAALATVVSTSGSTYRRPGARLLITESDAVGAVSAGCLEDEVIALAQRVVESGQPQLIRFDTTEEMDAIAGTGLGCRGTIEVFIESLAPEHSGAFFYRTLQKALRQDRSPILTLMVESNTPQVPIGTHFVFIDDESYDVFEEDIGEPFMSEQIGQDLHLVSSWKPTVTKWYELQSGSVRVYWERMEPPSKLLLFGAGYDAQPLVKLANELGFRVTVVDHRPTYLTRKRFPKANQLVQAHPRELHSKIHMDHCTFVVIMSHNYLHDLEILKFALQSEAPYIGQMGPLNRTQELLAEIGKGLGPLLAEKLARLHAPVGLNLGAESPEEIALSIMSEILAVKNAREAGFLKERKTPIHIDEAPEI